MKTLLDVENFIRTQLPVLLALDLRELRIVKEADLECCAYFHLRKFFGEKTTWKALARKHVPHTGHYIDILIFEEHTPQIAIDLKWGKKEIGKKDRASLESALDQLGVNKAYWISALPSNQYTTPPREEGDRYTLHQIIVPLELSDEALPGWKKARAQYRSKMAIGTGRGKK